MVAMFGGLMIFAMKMTPVIFSLLCIDSWGVDIMSKRSSMSHNVCYDKKFRALLVKYFDSYFDRRYDENFRFGLTRMFRLCLSNVYDINPVISVFHLKDNTHVVRLDLISCDGCIDFGAVKCYFYDDISVSVDFSGIK